MANRSLTQEEFAAKMSRRADALTLICLRAQEVVETWEQESYIFPSPLIRTETAIAALAEALQVYKDA